ncbi:permease prefix domain 1-containing protein [Brevibacillus massiliensis]|uniref:permease prefix domain 1-containing protein n=1 Tax=Brevibacillus massiliensis TaxID=1118054 RepID=UPI00030C8BB6|nr:permease prefix domain 1-containing protein [Brevibacillus massiliensis]
MKELEEYVAGLFARYPETSETKELKSEILSNLEAKVKDHMQDGMTYEDAVIRATKSIDSIDFLIDGHQSVYLYRFISELVQMALLSVLIAWIVTIPLRIVWIGMWVNSLFTFAVALCGLLYVILLALKNSRWANSVSSVNLVKLGKLRKAVWMLWGMYVLVMTAFTAAVKFASNVWFGRAIQIDGPYQFAVVSIDFALPFLSIIVPIIFHQARILAEKYGVNAS